MKNSARKRIIDDALIHARSYDVKVCSKVFGSWEDKEVCPIGALNGAPYESDLQRAASLLGATPEDLWSFIWAFDGFHELSVDTTPRRRNLAKLGRYYRKRYLAGEL